MGVAYPEDLNRLGAVPGLVEVVQLVRTAMNHVVASLCDGDPSVTGSLQDAERALRALRRGIEDQALAILASRAGSTVAELRVMVAAAHVNADAECIADLARQLAEIARSRPSRSPAPAELQAIVCRMGQVCLEMAAMAGKAVESSGADAVAEMDAASAEVSRLQRLLYRRLLAGSDTVDVDVDAALDVTLASRYWVRCAEHTLSMARHGALCAGGSLG